jgi:hypothetical protein
MAVRQYTCICMRFTVNVFQFPKCKRNLLLRSVMEIFHFKNRQEGDRVTLRRIFGIGKKGAVIGSPWGQGTCWTTNVMFSGRARNVFFAFVDISAVMWTSLYTRLVPGRWGLFPELKRLDRKDYFSPPSYIEVKNAFELYCLSYVFTGVWIIKHSKNLIVGVERIWSGWKCLQTLSRCGI